MEQSPSWKANSHSTGQEIYRLSWNLKTYYLVRKNLSEVPTQSQMNPVHTTGGIMQD